MEIGRVDLLTNAHSNLMPQYVGKGTLHGFLHGAFDATGDSELARARCRAHFETVEADLALIIHRSRVHRPRCERIRGNHVSTSLFREANEAFLPRIAVNVGERGLVILEGAHLLELLLDTPTPFQGQR